MFTLAAETFFQVLLCNVASIVNVEMMESKEHVVLSDCLSSVNSDGQELCIVDLAISIEVDPLEDAVGLLLAKVKFVERRSDLGNRQSARVVLVESAESVAKFGKVESASVDLIHKEGEGLDLETLGLSEVLDASEHEHLVRVRKCLMGVLNILSLEPGMVQAVLGRDTSLGILVEHFRYEIFRRV